MPSLNLHLRDMRQLFSSQAKSEPAISVRRNCVLVNFETLRGIVLVDRYVGDSRGSSRPSPELETC